MIQGVNFEKNLIEISESGEMIETFMSIDEMSIKRFNDIAKIMQIARL